MIKYQYEPNGDVRLEGDTAEEVEREINSIKIFNAERDQQITFIGPYAMIGGRYAALGKVSCRS